MQGLVDAFESSCHVVEVVGLEAHGKGGLGGAEPDGGTGVFEGFGQDENALEHEAVELGAGEACGVGPQPFEAVLEVGVVHPAVEGGAADACHPGGVGHGGRIDKIR